MKKICLLLVFLSIALNANANTLGSGLPGYSSQGLGAGVPGRYGSQTYHSQRTYTPPVSSTNYNNYNYNKPVYTSPITSPYKSNTPFGANTNRIRF